MKKPALDNDFEVEDIEDDPDLNDHQAEFEKTAREIGVVAEDGDD